MTTATDMVAAYLAAETAILQGKEVRLGGAFGERMLRMEDLSAVRAGRIEWERRVAAEAADATTAAATRIGGLSFSLFAMTPASSRRDR